MKSDVRNNFPGNSLLASNKNKFEASVFDGRNGNGEISLNNNNRSSDISPHTENSQCRLGNAEVGFDAINGTHYTPYTIMPYRQDRMQYCWQQGAKAKSTEAQTLRARAVISEKPGPVKKPDQTKVDSRIPNQRRASEFVVFNPYFTEHDLDNREGVNTCNKERANRGTCKSLKKSVAGGCNIDMTDVSSRKEILNDAISNALSSSDQLINLRELSNAISYNRTFEACNCQSLYDELIFPCIKPTAMNVIKNSSAKEAPFVLGQPKRRPNFLKNSSTEISGDGHSCKMEEAHPQRDSSLSKYILPMPQVNNSSGSDDKQEAALKTQESDDGSDNFDKSEYLKFKQIACSGDDFKLKLFFDGMSKKRPPPLQNRSSSFPQTDDVAETNPDASLSSPGRKYSHPTMNFQSNLDDIQRSRHLPANIKEIKESLPLKPVPQYACNAVKPEPLPMEQKSYSVIKPSDLNSNQNPIKSASKRRQEFSMRRASAPTTEVYIAKEKTNVRCDAPPGLESECTIVYHRRSTIGPETISQELRHSMARASPGRKHFNASCSKDASLLLRRRSRLFCDGFRSLDQMSTCTTSITTCDNSCRSSSSSDLTSSDSTSCTSSSSWSISSSNSSESSELY